MKASPREGFGTALFALVACQIGLHACTQGARMAAPLQALKSGQGALTVGLLLALFALLPALLAIPAGRLADRFGYHRPVRIAAGLSLCGALIAAASAHTLALCAAAALCGAGSGFGMIAVQRTAGRMAQGATERMRIFSWVALAPAVANLIGPLLAGVLIDSLGFRAAFAALAMLPAATLLIAQALPREFPAAALPTAQRRPPAWDLLREPAFCHLLVINWLVSTSWDVFGFALPIDVAPPERQGEALALRSMSVHLSMATMPLVFGAAGAAIGAAALFWVMALALCAGSWRARGT